MMPSLVCDPWHVVMACYVYALFCCLYHHTVSGSCPSICCYASIVEKQVSELVQANRANQQAASPTADSEMNHCILDGGNHGYGVQIESTGFDFQVRLQDDSITHRKSSQTLTRVNEYGQWQHGSVEALAVFVRGVAPCNPVCTDRYFKALLAQEEVPRGAEDLDDFRRKMAVRKRRSKAFLQNPTALFKLLFGLCMNFLVDVPVKICFMLFDADKDGLGIANPQKEERRCKRRRLRCKGANALHIPPIDSEKKYDLTDLHVSSLKVVDYVWKALEAPLDLTVFQVPAIFWPEMRSSSDMFRFMSSDMLQVLAAFKWRVSYKFCNPPFCLLGMLSEGCSEEAKTCLTQKFLDMNSCCLSQFWGQPVKEELLSGIEGEGSVPADVLQLHVSKFAKQCRAVSIREERQHAIQRTFAGGWRSKARSFWQHSA